MRFEIEPTEDYSDVEDLLEIAFNEGWRSREARPGQVINSRAEMRKEWLGSNARDTLTAAGLGKGKAP